MRPTRPRAGDKWETNERQTGDKEAKSCHQPDPEWETNERQKGDKEGKSCHQPDPEWETNERQKGDKEGKSCHQPDPEWETSGRQMKDKCRKHSEDASPETQSKSYDQGKQPFLRSKNPIQVNLFGEQHLMRVFFATGATIDPIDLGWP